MSLRFENSRGFINVETVLGVSYHRRSRFAISESQVTDWSCSSVVTLAALSFSSFGGVVVGWVFFRGRGLLASATMVL